MRPQSGLLVDRRCDDRAAVDVYGYMRAIRSGGSSAGLGLGRLVSRTACYAAEIARAILLTAGQVAGLYVALVAIVAYFALSVFLGVRSVAFGVPVIRSAGRR